MIRIVLNVAIFVGILLIGVHVFGVNPTWQEILVVLLAAGIADAVTEVGR